MERRANGRSLLLTGHKKVSGWTCLGLRIAGVALAWVRTAVPKLPLLDALVSSSH